MLHHMLRAAAQRAFQTLDPYFKYVTMLLHGDGSALGSDTVTPFNSDASTNAFNVTINGDARSNNFNPYQAGYYSNYFDGSGDYLSVTGSALDASTTTDYTVEFWMYTAKTASTQMIYELGTGATNDLQIYVSTTALVFQVDGNTPTTTVSFTDNSWVHVACVKTSGTLTTYINGVGTTVDTGVTVTSKTTAYIGMRAGTSLPFTGYLSNMRVNRSAVYTGNFTPPTSPLTAITNTALLTCQSNRFIDNSTNAFTITVNGNTSIAPAQPFTLPSSVATYGSGYFDGSGDYLTAPSNAAFSPGTSDFTIECWAYITAVSSEGTLFYVSATNGINLFLSISSNWGIARAGVAVDNNFGTPPVFNTWNHLAVSRSGSTIRAFINGVQVFSGSNSSNYAQGAALIGSSNGFGTVTGYITDFRFVKGTAVYTSAFTPPTAPLTAITNTSLLTTQYNGAGNNNGFKDSSQNNFVITRNGNTTQGTFSPYGSNWSNYFDGNGDYLSIANNTALNITTGDFTIECWIFCTALTSGNQNVINKDGVAGASLSQYAIQVTSTGKVRIGVGDGNGTIGQQDLTGATTISLNTWNHIAFVKNSTTLTLYLNGVSDVSATQSVTMYSGTKPLLIGWQQGQPTAEYFNGYISNARLVKGTAVYTSAFTPPTAPLTAITNTSLLTCADNRFIDDSTNNLTITPNGNTSVQRFSPFSPTVSYSTTVNGGSAYFDGSGDYLNLGSQNALPTTTQDFTIEFWAFKTSAWSSSNQFFCNSNASGGVQIWVNTSLGYLRLGAYAVAPVLDYSYSNLQTNTWIHFAYSRSGNSFALWVNGTRVATTTSSQNFGSSPTITTIGGSDTGSDVFGGYISDFRVVRSAVVYNPSSSTITVPTAPLTAITNTSLLLSNTNAGVLDNAMMNDLETVGNAQISTSVKKYGAGSMYFDGSGDYLAVPSSPNLGFASGDFTVEGWLYLNSYPGTSAAMYVCDFRNGSTNNFGFGVIGVSGFARPYMFVGSGPVDATGSTSLSLGVWYHIAMVRSGSTVTYYLNGVSDATMTTSYSQGATGVTIGARYTGSTEYVNGYIDDLRITKGVARYTTTFTPPTAAFPNN